MTLSHYHNRFHASQNYEKIMFLPVRALQAAELNEIQDMTLHQIRSFGDAVFKDGDVVSGCICIVRDNVVTVEAGNIYLKGAVRSVPAATLNINSTERFSIGVYLKERVITALEDPTLRDPTPGIRNFNEEGGARLQRSLTWAAEPLSGAATDRTLGEFYPVVSLR